MNLLANVFNRKYLCKGPQHSFPSIFLDPLTPKISSLILLTVCHIVLVMLFWRIWYLIN